MFVSIHVNLDTKLENINRLTGRTVSKFFVTICGNGLHEYSSFCVPSTSKSPPLSVKSIANPHSRVVTGIWSIFISLSRRKSDIHPFHYTSSSALLSLACMSKQHSLRCHV